MKDRRNLFLLLVVAVFGTVASDSGSSWQRKALSHGNAGILHHRPSRLKQRTSIDTSLALRGGASKKKTSDCGTTSMASSVFNLVNNVAGAGILALAAGKAGGTGWIPAILICTILGALSAHSFIIIGEACELTGERDFKGLWSRTIGVKTTYIVDSMIAIMCLAASVIYSGILGDVCTPLLARAGLAAKYNSRTTNILAVNLAFLLPMSLIKDLSALAFTSILGFSAIMYTVLFSVVRAVDGSYKAGTGKFVTDGVLELLPSFDKSTVWNFDFTSLVLASNLGLAYISHYNAPLFYRSLKDTNSKRFGQMVGFSFALLILLYIVTLAAGYSTFGDVCHGNILLNYHPDDILSTLGRVATWFSILFGFPLVMAGAREGLIGTASSLGFPQLGADANHFRLVASLLAFTTFVSCTVQDVSLVVGLTGAAMGSFIVYICPALIYTKAVRLVKGQDSTAYQRSKINLAMVPFGILIGGLGVYMTIKESS